MNTNSNAKNDSTGKKSRSNLAVINTETGEIISEVASYRTVAQQEAYQQLKHKETQIASEDTKQERFIFAGMQELKERLKSMTELTFRQLGYLAVISTYAGYDGILKLTEQSNVPMNKAELKKVLKIGKDNTINDLIKDLKTAGFLTEITVDKYGRRRTAFLLDTSILFRGAGAGNGANEKAKLWQANIQQAFNEGTVTVYNLGLLFAVIPYLSYESNILAYDVTEREGDKVQGIAIVDLAEMLNIDVSTLQRNMNSAKFNGMHIFGKTQAGKEKFIKINPLIVYRKAGVPPLSSYIEFVAKSGKPKKKTVATKKTANTKTEQGGTTV